MTRNTRDSDTPQPRPAPSVPDAEAEGAAFWRFSLALYAGPGVADALLALQDRAGSDVNLILFGLWVGVRYGCDLGADGAAAAAAIAGPNGVVRDIRALRRRIGEAQDGDVRPLRRALLSIELAAERRVQMRLAACAMAQTLRPGQDDRLAAALANLACVLGGESNSPEAALLRRALAALTRHP